VPSLRVEQDTDSTLIVMAPADARAAMNLELALRHASARTS
jgi:hypothetical protein